MTEVLRNDSVIVTTMTDDTGPCVRILHHISTLDGREPVVLVLRSTDDALDLGLAILDWVSDQRLAGRTSRREKRA